MKRLNNKDKYWLVNCKCYEGVDKDGNDIIKNDSIIFLCKGKFFDAQNFKKHIKPNILITGFTQISKEEYEKRYE